MNANIKKNMVWNAFGNIVYLGCQWLVTILVTRLLGYEVAGVLSLAMSISASFQTLALFGIRNFQVSDINGQYSDSCYVGLRNLTCVATLCLCMMFAAANSYSVNVMWAVFWFMLFRLSENYSDVLHGIFQKNERLYMAGQSLFIKGLSVLIGFIGGYMITGTLNGGLAIMTVLSLCVTVFFDFVRAKKLSGFILYDDLKHCAALAKETLPLCVYMFLNSITTTAPKYLLEKMCSEELLGAYSSIFAPALLIQAVAQYMYMPFITRFATLYECKNVKGFIQLSTKILILILGLGLVFLIAAVFLGEWGLTLLFTDSIRPYVGLLFLIIIGTFTTAINVFYLCLGVVMRLMKQLVVSCAVEAVFCCIVSVATIRIWSADGASMGLIAGTVVGSVIMHICIENTFKEIRRN